VRFFAGKDSGVVISFDLVIYELVFGLFGFAWTEPELNFVSAILSKEGIDY